MRLRITHTVHQVNDDICIQSHIAVQLHCWAYSLHAALCIGKGTFFFRIADTGKDNVRILCRFCHEQLLDDKEIKIFQRFNNMVGIRVCNNRILTINVKTFYLAFNGCREHFCGVQTIVWIQLHAPGFFKFFTYFRIFHLLISRVILRSGSHIAGALYVVLSADRVDAAALAAQLTYQQSHIGHRHNALCTGGMLGYTQTVDDRSLICFCIHDGSPSQVIRVYMADFPDFFRGVIFYDLLDLFIAFRSLFNELHILKAFFDDHVHNAIGKGNIGARS